MEEKAWEDPCSDDMSNREGMGWKVSLSILVGVGWLSFLIIWLFFYASEYSGYKNFAIFLLSIVAIAVILGIPWAVFGWKHQKKSEAEMWKTKGFRWRAWLSMILMIGLVCFLIYWFWYLAQDFNRYQNIAIFIVSILIFGGIMGASWAAWGIKHGQQNSHHQENKKMKP